tara:strand:+ start:15443 stop:15769 length:327 start_codon:yes stop_codon:yes gene_type:complete
MSKSLTYQNVTKKDAIDVGIKFILLKEWLKIISQIYQWFKNHNMKVKHDGDGVIIYDGFEIKLNVVNNQYLQFEVSKGEVDLLSMRHSGNVKLLLRCLVAVLADPSTK